MAKSKRKKKKLHAASRYGYQGAQHNRLTSDWSASGATADLLVHTDGPALRNRARSLDRDNDYVVSAINKLCIKVLGDKPPIFQSRIKKIRSSSQRPELNEPLNDRIEQVFKVWCSDRASIDVSKRWDLNQILDLCLRALAVDGEVFIRKVKRARGRSPVKFALELIEADNIADTYHGDRQGAPIVGGIEYDEWGAPAAYWFYPYNPHDSLYGRHRNYYGKGLAEPVRYPASEIIHLYSPRRITQGRGVSWLSATISRLRNLLGYEQAVLVGARMRAAVMGFIETPEGEDAYGSPNEDNPTAPRQYSFEPGTIQVLNEGENFNLASTTDPGPNLEGFGRYMLRAFAANLGISYSSLSGDYSQANYSSERAAKLDENRAIGRLQNHLKTIVLCNIADTFLDQAALQSVISIPPGRANPDYMCQYDWRLAGFEFVDPQKDADAYVTQLENGMTSLRRVLAAKGIDLIELLEERQYEQELLEKYGVKLAYLAELEQPEQPPEDEGPSVQEGLTEVRSIVANQSEQIGALMGALQETNRTLGLMGHSLAEIKGQQREPVTVNVHEARRELPAPKFEGLVPVRDYVSRAKNCKTGKPCGGSCISQAKSCLADLSPAQKKLAVKARNAMKKGVAGPSNPISPQPTAPTGPTASQDILTVRAAIESGDIDSMVDAVNRLYGAGKTQAKKDGVNFYNSIKGGNGTTDPLTTIVLTEAGFNGLPEQLSSKDMGQLDPKQNLLFYRNPSVSNFKNRFDQFKNADGVEYTSGRGIYCSGTYVAANYAGTKKGGSDALSAANAYGRGTMKMAIDRNDAVIVKGSDLSNEQAAFRKQLRTWERNQRANLSPDPAREAQELIRMNSLKPSTREKFKISNDLVDYELDLRDPQTKAKQRIQGTLSKNKITRGATPWTFSDEQGAASPAFKTRKEAIQWAIENEAKKRSVDDRELRRKVRRIKLTVYGDDDGGGSGRFAVLKGYDFVQLNQAYDPTYGLMLNRSKVKVQKTRASSTKP